MTINPACYMTPTDHEKMEWARFANACYANGYNLIGHKFSNAACLPRNAPMDIYRFDSLQRDYRAWLIDNKYPDKV